MMLLSIIIFGFCVWAVFSHNFRDGIIVKHLLSFSAITSMLVILDPVNTDAFIASLVMLVAGIAYWANRRAARLRAAIRRLHLHY